MARMDTDKTNCETEEGGIGATTRAHIKLERPVPTAERRRRFPPGDSGFRRAGLRQIRRSFGGFWAGDLNAQTRGYVASAPSVRWPGKVGRCFRSSVKPQDTFPPNRLIRPGHAQVGECIGQCPS